MSRRNAKDAGFSLIEVLAALLVFSTAIIGLIHAGTQGAQSVSILEQKMLAGIVADNVLTEAQVAPVVKGTQTGEAVQMSRRFDWTLRTVDTELPGFLRMTAEVRMDGGEQIIVIREAYRDELENTEPAPIDITPPEPDE